MTRSHLGHWGLGTGLGSAIAAAISPSAQAATAAGSLEMRIEIQRSCSVAPAARSSTAISVDCNASTPYAIDTAPAAPDSTGKAMSREQPSQRIVSPPDTRRAVIVTVRY